LFRQGFYGSDSGSLNHFHVWSIGPFPANAQDKTGQIHGDRVDLPIAKHPSAQLLAKEKQNSDWYENSA
jgi:hypothetical protein